MSKDAGSVDLSSEDNETSRILEETKEYYRLRAPQYADWSQPTGDYEGDSEPDASWFAEARIAIDALKESMLTGNVLEIASGTGIWTELLVGNAASVTALDSSQEMIERAETRLKGNPKVRFIHADIYEWIPNLGYDAVTFAFWISHVPNTRLEQFVSKVVQCLKPGGKVFFVDQREEARTYEIAHQPNGEVVIRRLGDGRSFKIIKHFYSAKEIQDVFSCYGIKMKVSITPTHFYYAKGEKEPVNI
jgi:ubiquinone/menaquinone biosynthesis C-methylase UbiE